MVRMRARYVRAEAAANPMLGECRIEDINIIVTLRVARCAWWVATGEYPQTLIRNVKLATCNAPP